MPFSLPAGGASQTPKVSSTSGWGLKGVTFVTCGWYQHPLIQDLACVMSRDWQTVNMKQNVETHRDNLKLPRHQSPDGARKPERKENTAGC